MMCSPLKSFRCDGAFADAETRAKQQVRSNEDDAAALLKCVWSIYNLLNAPNASRHLKSDKAESSLVICVCVCVRASISADSFKML